ncbi:MAG: hypothetical protein JWR66_2165 [Modestobacter sp.]|nr:hypothetical protein [Modestobacter sp.]
MTDSRIDVHRAAAGDTATARPSARSADPPGPARRVHLAETLLRDAVEKDYPGSQVQLALSIPSHPVYSRVDVGTPHRVRVDGREGFSMPLALTLSITEVPEPVQQDVFAVDDHGWKPCSPAPAGELGATP